MVLTNEQRKELTARLLERRAELEGTAGTTDEAAAVVKLDQSRMGRLSRMDALQSQALSVEMRRRNAGELAAIGAALERMGDGSYGLCLRCEEEIGLPRLRAKAVATLCIECANRAEQHSR